MGRRGWRITCLAVVVAVVAGCTSHHSERPLATKLDANYIAAATQVRFDGQPCSLLTTADIQRALGGHAASPSPDTLSLGPGSACLWRVTDSPLLRSGTMSAGFGAMPLRRADFDRSWTRQNSLILGGLGDARLRLNDNGVSDLVGDHVYAFNVPFDKGVSLNQRVAAYYKLITPALDRLRGSTLPVLNGRSVDTCGLLTDKQIRSRTSGPFVGGERFTAKGTSNPYNCTWGPVSQGRGIGQEAQFDIGVQQASIATFIDGLTTDKTLDAVVTKDANYAGYRSADGTHRWAWINGIVVHVTVGTYSPHHYKISAKDAAGSFIQGVVEMLAKTPTS